MFRKNQQNLGGSSQDKNQLQNTTVKNFFQSLANQNKRKVQEKSNLWSFDFENGREVFESDQLVSLLTKNDKV